MIVSPLTKRIRHQLRGSGIRSVDLRPIVQMLAFAGFWEVPAKNKPTKRGDKVKNIANKIAVFAVMSVLAVSQAHATAYFTLPADFSDNVQATIVGIAGGILVILGLMFAWRKTVKSVNRS